LPILFKASIARGIADTFSARIAILISDTSAATHSVAIRALTQRSEWSAKLRRQLNSQPTAQKLVTVGDNSAPATHQQDFFAVLAARRHQASAGSGSDVDEELSKYLSDQSSPQMLRQS